MRRTERQGVQSVELTLDACECARVCVPPLLLADGTVPLVVDVLLLATFSFGRCRRYGRRVSGRSSDGRGCRTTLTDLLLEFLERLTLNFLLTLELLSDDAKIPTLCGEE